MKLRLPSDLGIRLLALVIAVALWFVAASDNSTPQVNLEERVVSAVVSLEGLGAGLVPVNKPSSVEVRLRAPGGVNIPDQLQAFANLSGRKAGDHRIPVTVTVPPRLTLISVSPDTVTVRLERQTTRNLAVELAIIGLPASVSVTASTPEPASVAITGAESRVQRVVRALAAVTYNPDNMSALVNVRPVDNMGVEVPEVTVKPRQVRVFLDGPSPGVSLETPEPGLSTAQITPASPVTPSPQTQPVQPSPRPVLTPKQPVPKQAVPTPSLGVAPD